MSAQPTRIIRGTREQEKMYFTSPKQPAQDRTMSWEARGVLWYILSQADDWEIHPKDLMQGCGRDKVYSILSELRSFRYMQRVNHRDALGKVVQVTYKVYDYPLPLPENTEVDEKDGCILLLPENTEMVQSPLPEIQETASAPLPEKPEAVHQPLPEKPEAAERNPEKQPLPDLPLPANTDIKELKTRTRTKNKDKDKTKDSASENDAGTSSEIPKKARKPIERSDVFKGLASGSFGIFETTELDKLSVIQINKIVGWLQENSPGATAQTLKAFYGWYSAKTNKMTPPRDATKFALHFNEFKQQHLKPAGRGVSAPPPTAPPIIHRTPEEIARMREQLALTRQEAKL